MEAQLTMNRSNNPYIKIDEYVLQLEREEFEDEYYKERAKLELRETSEVSQQAINELITLISTEPDLHLPIEDPSYLIKFLRPCKFYAESTFRLIKRYYKFIEKHPKLTSELIPRTVQIVFSNNVLEFLPLRLNGARIMIVDLMNWNPKKIPLALLWKSVIMSMEIAMIEPKTQVGGVHIILDVAGLTLKKIFEFTPSMAKLILEFVQECTVIRLLGIHIVNQPYIFNVGYAIFKPFIGQKLKQRLHFHGTNWDELKRHMNEDCLPERFGGKLSIPRIPGELFVKLLAHYDSEFEDLTKYGYIRN